MKEETRKRREARRAQVAREKAERLERLAREAASRGHSVFRAKARKGDALEIQFQFSGVPVPVADPNNPDGPALVRATDAMRVLKPKDDQNVN
jgi:hypothetical protein